jgi:hypothetical protein
MLGNSGISVEGENVLIIVTMLVLTDAGDIPFIHCLILISHT